MIEAVRALHALGASFEAAVRAATATPASVIKATSVGRLAVGGAADLVVLDDRLEILRVMVAGETRVAA
jgi:N-acetylglucosamine-6-phosphate deacetylase